jgi:hypothetical protein
LYVHTLRTISGTILHISPLGHPFINLTYNTHLRFVELRVSQLGKLSEHVLFAMSTLSRIRSRHLEQVDFYLGGRSWTDYVCPNPEWIEVDTMLASSQFATLKDVRIYTLPFPPDVANLPALFAALLPTCHARGILSHIDVPFRRP